MAGFNQEEIIKLAAKEGAKAGIDKYKAEQLEKQKQLVDRRLRNIKLLLKNYRKLKKHSENAKYRVEQAESEINILELMWDPNNKSETVIESIKASAVKTRIIIAHIDGMISTYRTMCENSGNETEKRRYEILYYRYIADNELTVDELAEKYYVDRRTIFYDLGIAMKKLAILIFGVDSIADKK